MSRTALRAYFTHDSVPWELENGRPFTDEETSRIDEMFAHCGCGGLLYPEDHKRARIRCPECKSRDVSRGHLEALVD